MVQQICNQLEKIATQHLLDAVMRSHEGVGACIFNWEIFLVGIIVVSFIIFILWEIWYRIF